VCLVPQYTNGFGINEIVSYFSEFFEKLFITCAEILIIPIKLNSVTALNFTPTNPSI
jgi:hypothetical protein